MSARKILTPEQKVGITPAPRFNAAVTSTVPQGRVSRHT